VVVRTASDVSNAAAAPPSLPRRRAIFLLLAGLPPGCMSTGFRPTEVARVSPPDNTTVRPAQVGQQWVYRIRNLYNREIIDEVVETVATTNPTIRIERKSLKYGPLPDEVQSQWGLIVQDPHWDPPIRLQKPLPVWPPDLGATEQTDWYRDEYALLADDGFYKFWNPHVTIRGWESITVPAGTFTVLRYDNHVRFLSNDVSHNNSRRDEEVWFAPTIGRWVVRRTSGHYYLPDRGGGTYEDERQWELVAWR